MSVADFCRENMLDYYEMVEALKQEKNSEVLRLRLKIKIKIDPKSIKKI